MDVFDNSFAKPIDRAPENAIWFYNMGAESQEIKEIFSRIAPPYNRNLLDIDGVYLLYGPHGAYQITKDTIFWMPNDIYQVEMISEHPWPDDYIDGLDSDPRVMRITIPFVS